MVKFQDRGENLLPFAETCVCSLSLPTAHKSYEDFSKYMSIALMVPWALTTLESQCSIWWKYRIVIHFVRAVSFWI